MGTGHGLSRGRFFPAHLFPHEPGNDFLAFYLQVLGFDTPEQIEKASNQTSPAGLMTSAEPRAIITVEVFVEEYQIAPVRIFLKRTWFAIDRPPVVFIAQKTARQPAGDFLGHFEERHVSPRSGGTFNFEVITVESVQVQ